MTLNAPKARNRRCRFLSLRAHASDRYQGHQHTYDEVPSDLSDVASGYAD